MWKVCEASLKTNLINGRDTKDFLFDFLLFDRNILLACSIRIIVQISNKTQLLGKCNLQMIIMVMYLQHQRTEKCMMI